MVTLPHFSEMYLAEVMSLHPIYKVWLNVPSWFSHCELDFFPEDTARVFENAIERLYYSDSCRIGNAVLPRSRIRAKLRLLNDLILRDAESKLAANIERKIKNSTAYTMATIFNCITESESDLLVDPYLNRLRATDPPWEVLRC